MSDIDKTTILFLAADPSDASRLRLGQEIRDIRERLQLAKMRDQFSLVERLSVRPGDVTQAIFDTEPQILHFSGHGTSEGELCLENEVGQVQPVHPEALASLFELIAHQVRCVILNTCYSETQAKAIAEHVDYVVGIKGEIGDRAAIAFAEGFYKALGGGRSIEDAYNFGIVELKLLGIPEHLKPVLVRKSPRIQRTDELSQLRSELRSDAWSSIFQSTYQWLVSDQLESGGWGISENLFTEDITHRKLSPVEYQEGGMISTFIALRALMSYEGDSHLFRARDYSRKALNYLLRRQTHKGGFGRFVESRSGIELHSTIRHTAYAVSSLIDLNGPPGAIFRGVKFLKENWSLDNILDDSTPSLAAAGILFAIDKFTSVERYTAIFSEEEQSELQLAEWRKVKELLIRKLIEMSKSSSFSPFWPPYGNHELRVYETALVTIDLVSHPLAPALGPTVADILSEILEAAVSDGIPYGLGLRTPDIGLSSLLLYLIARPRFLDSIGDLDISKRLLKFSTRLNQFLLDKYGDHNYKRYTQADNLPHLLLLKRGSKFTWEDYSFN